MGGGVREALGDSCFHFADCAVGRWVEVDEGAVFAVRDEVAVCAGLFGGIDEGVDWEGAGPGFFSSLSLYIYVGKG